MTNPTRRALLGGLAATAALAPARALAQETPAYTLKIATVAPTGTPWTEGLNEFKKMVEGGAGGRMKVKVFAGGTLGDENETVTSTQRGQIQGVGASTGALASLVAELNVLELPFLFKSATEADHVLDNVVLSAMETAFKSRGLVLGFWSENGYRCFGTNYGFIKTPTDLKGHKIRSQENPAHIEMYRAFGASPVPIPTTEVLTSLQTGVVDGYDNTPLFAQAAQWMSVTKYFTLSRHIYQPAAIVFNKAWFEALPADLQALLLSARTTLVAKMRKQIRALDPILVQNLAAMNVQVYTPTKADLSTFDVPAATARNNYIATKASSAEKTMYSAINAGISAYRAKGGR
jgi:TRAP-type transport system periplasmic protein